MNEPTFSKFELSAAEIIAKSRDLADSLEAMMIEAYQSRIETTSIQPAKITSPDFAFKKAGTSPLTSDIHPTVLQLADPKAIITWNKDPKSLVELRNYAFMNIAAKSNGQIGFQYLTARNPKVNYMSKMTTEVYNTLEVDKIYILHTVKKSGKNYWDKVIVLPMTDSEIYSRAKVLSKFYAELLVAGEI